MAQTQECKADKTISSNGFLLQEVCKEFATLVRPMVELTKKGKKFIWDEACEQSFKSLKEALVGTEVMGLPSQ